METEELEKINFNATLPIQIRFNDIDALGHINNNIYLSYFDLGKVNYFDRMRGSSVSWTEGSIVLAHLEMDFLMPTFYREEVAVESKIVRVGNKSGNFIQRLVNVKTREVKCICKSVFVFIDSASQKPANIPHAWREAINKFEGTSF